MAPPLLDRDQFDELTQNQVPAGKNLDAALTAVSESVRSACGWHIAPVVIEEMILDGPGGDLLHLRSLRLVDVLSCTQRPRGRGAATAVEVDSLEVSPLGMVRIPGRWTERLGGITITVRHGWSTVPADLQAIIAKIVTRLAVPSLGVAREAAGPISIEFVDAAAGVTLLESEKASLLPWTIGTLP